MLFIQKSYNEYYLINNNILSINNNICEFALLTLFR